MKAWILIAGLLLMMFLLAIGSPLPTVLITLAVGWYFSVVRLIGSLHPGGSAIVLFGLALIVLVAGSHFCFRWLYASLQTGQRDLPLKWRWKWTLCGYAML